MSWALILDIKKSYAKNIRWETIDNITKYQLYCPSLYCKNALE